MGEQSSSESSSEPQSIESVLTVEDIEYNCQEAEDEDMEDDKHDFISEIVSSMFIQSTSENALDIERYSPEQDDNHFKLASNDLFCDSPLDDFHSDADSEKGESTNEGIVATSDDDNDVEKDIKKKRKISIGEDEDNNELFYHCR